MARRRADSCSGTPRDFPRDPPALSWAHCAVTGPCGRWVHSLQPGARRTQPRLLGRGSDCLLGNKRFRRRDAAPLGTAPTPALGKGVRMSLLQRSSRGWGCQPRAFVYLLTVRRVESRCHGVGFSSDLSPWLVFSLCPRMVSNRLSLGALPLLIRTSVTG